MITDEKGIIFGYIDLMTDEINDNIRLGTQVSTIKLAIEYGELVL